MKRIVRLTESDLARIVRRVISESPIKNTYDFTIPGDDAAHLKLKSKVGGMVNVLAGNPNVVEFDATLNYSKNPAWDGSFDEKNKGRIIPIKGYYGCKTGKITAKDPGTGRVENFYENNMGVFLMPFTKFLSEKGLCPAGSL